MTRVRTMVGPLLLAILLITPLLGAPELREPSVRDEATQSPAFISGVQLNASSVNLGADSCMHENGDMVVVGTFSGTLRIGQMSLSGASGTTFAARIGIDGAPVWLVKPTAGGDESELVDPVCLNDNRTIIAGNLAGLSTFANDTMMSNGDVDILVTALSANGTWLWGRSFGDVDADYVVAAAADNRTDEIWIAGKCENATSLSIGPTTIACDGNAPVLASIDANGTWQGALPINVTNGFDNRATTLTVDQWGRVYVAGWMSDSLTFSDGTQLNTSAGAGWIACWSTLTESWDWISNVEGLTLNDMLLNNNVLEVVGFNEGNVSAGNVNATGIGEIDIFVGRLDWNGNWVHMAVAGSTAEDVAEGVGLSPENTLIIVGGIKGYGAFGNHTYTTRGMDGFLAEYDLENSTWKWFAKVTAVGWNSADSSVHSTHTFGEHLVAVGVFAESTMNFNGTRYNQANGGSDGFISISIPDADEDGLPNTIDDCPYGATGWTSNNTADHDGDGCRDVDEDDNDDNDPYLDAVDTCDRGHTNWTLNATNDYDTDGCHDQEEDGDDDNDGRPDSQDQCRTGEMGWTSNATSDYDNDGCRDVTEDLDDDGDGVLDASDSCPAGDKYWGADATTDVDGDGCRDDGIEDLDDDGDSVQDPRDDCPRGATHWTPTAATDYDEDGCHDGLEDGDDDNDAVPDASDNCATGSMEWLANLSTDHDGDGCQDAHAEDPDDDEDGVLDVDDTCPKGRTHWIPDTYTDNDGDGCHDETEDEDDDEDSIPDIYDACPDGVKDWELTGTDHDTDGCEDGSEDTDDDDDGHADWSDGCPLGALNYNESEDMDSDGCVDAIEDDDDDGDGILDVDDRCAEGEIDWYSRPALDKDGDGCRDETEDWDDDDDNIHDEFDMCPDGWVEWLSTDETDLDDDGCHDEHEDDDDDGDGKLDTSDACPRAAGTSERDRVGCPDADGDGWSDPDADAPAHPIGTADAFPNDPINWWDADGDGCGNNADDFPNDATQCLDSDGDGVGDEIDAFPDDIKEWADGDGDGVGDNLDRCKDTPVGKEVYTNGCHTNVKSTGGVGDQLKVIAPFIIMLVGVVFFIWRKLKPPAEADAFEAVAEQYEAPAADIDQDAARAYYENCIEMGHDHTAALGYTRTHFPGFEL